MSLNIKTCIAVVVVGVITSISLYSQSSQVTTMPTQLVDDTTDMTVNTQSIVLGSGCFWGAEKRYEAITGVIDAVSGYADGSGFDPTYKNIIKRKNKFNPDNYAEVVKVTFNANQLSLESLLQNYFEGHDPTQGNRQGNDIGTQYRSTILYADSEQKAIAEKVAAEYQRLLTEGGYGKLTTKIASLDAFHLAEAYHQDYLAKNPNGYCPDHSTGIVFNKIEKAPVDNSALLAGKQVVIIDSEDYCPYCEKFKKETANEYKGTIPMSFRYASQLDGLDIQSETWATPTLIFLEEGKEVYARKGYLSSEQFYQLMGAFKLGKSEAYRVAFNEGTDSRFCKQYEIFKNTPDGVFIDKLSGAALFDTRYRFNSGTGWLSFTRPVEGQVYEKADYSYGMNRVEIRSKSSNIHLGHVFNDGPNGQPRYCINATVLEFLTRDEYESREKTATVAMKN